MWGNGYHISRHSQEERHGGFAIWEVLKGARESLLQLSWERVVVAWLPTSANSWRLNLGIAEHCGPSLEKKGCRYGVWKEWDQDQTDGRLVVYASRRTRHDFRRGRRGSSCGVCQAWGFCRVVLLSPALGRL